MFGVLFGSGSIGYVLVLSDAYLQVLRWNRSVSNRYQSEQLLTFREFWISGSGFSGQIVNEMWCAFRPFCNVPHLIWFALNRTRFVTSATSATSSSTERASSRLYKLAAALVRAYQILAYYPSRVIVTTVTKFTEVSSNVISLRRLATTQASGMMNAKFGMDTSLAFRCNDN